ncbi:2974_t:CDS:2 [Funneliformis geosporum]|uniref:Calmodulin-lysine N-methyltransferase n=1 Tax=Funneliformis geosporum TaxID=1117311 RepID=A0A9W4WXL3_9GLOM|nr:8334_t:CDS:2 [Funneliformis geosporum]CAI2180428.1 2974_t:CDS:2 [Funneliformis geosporum]
MNSYANTKKTAKSRWKLLRSVIISSSNTQHEINTTNSTKRHKEFNLFPRRKRTLTNNDNIPQLEEWFTYDLYDHVILNIRIKVPRTIDIKATFSSEYSGFLNTGNLCIWPSEEELFSDVDICSMQMLWNKNTVYDIQCNIVICADCTFDKETHPHLLHAIRSVLKKSDKSLFILCAPRRGDSLQAFVTLLETTSEFRIELLEKYDEIVWKSHEKSLKEEQGYYDTDAHYPLIVRASWNL